MRYLDLHDILKSEGLTLSFDEENNVSSESDEFKTVQLHGFVKNIVGVLVFKATATGLCHTVCDRCTDEVCLPLTASLDTKITLTESKDDSVLLTNGKADLARTALDALILERPIRVLCSEDCKGICPNCGINLNHGMCQCTEKTN